VKERNSGTGIWSSVSSCAGPALGMAEALVEPAGSVTTLQKTRRCPPACDPCACRRRSRTPGKRTRSSTRHHAAGHGLLRREFPRRRNVTCPTILLSDGADPTGYVSGRKTSRMQRVCPSKMESVKASRTTEYMALYRAMESARPRRKRLFTDPLAIHFLRPSLRTAAVLCRIPLLAEAFVWYADRRAPGARTSAIARTRLIDDVVSQALTDRIRQVVILGAGYDCRLYRLSSLSGFVAFEVDHPATLAAKLSRLRDVIRELPGNVRYVEIDFGRQDLAGALERRGFDQNLPSIFVWEGVTNYLSAEAVDAVLHYVAGCSPGTRLVFTYVHRGVIDGSASFPDAARIISNVAKLGEPWIFGFAPEELPSHLYNQGLQLERDDDARQYRREYYGRDAESMNGYDFYHVAVVRVAGRM
jgi:methyltransferase (TIGR00027 family)